MKAIWKRMPRGLRRYALDPALRLRVQRWAVRPAGWLAAPLRIALISDFHLGAPTMPLDRLRQVVRRTNATGPDLILLGGDYAPAAWPVTAPVAMAAAAEVLAGLAAPLGRFAVLGNHDWKRQPPDPAANTYGAALRAAGIPVLSNDALRLRDFWLLGLEDQRVFGSKLRGYTGLDDLPGTLTAVTDDAPVLLLAHEPDIFPSVPPRVALTLSGHTHGGQGVLFGRTPLVPSHYGSRFAYGHIHEAGRDLVVSGGLGCSGIQLRLGRVPEVTVIEVGP